MKTARKQTPGVPAEKSAAAFSSETPAVHPTVHRELPPEAVPNRPTLEGRDLHFVQDVACTQCNSRTDEQLIAAYQTGDKISFAELVSRYERELYHFLVRFLSDKTAAEDVFQETFLQIHQSAHDFDTQRRFRPWLFTIAANKARDLIRSNSRRPTNPLQANINGHDDEGGEFLDLMRSSDESPSLPMEKRELRQKVQVTVTNMPENLREILLLSYFHQFPYKQISDILDIPLGTVKSRLHAAVANFADRWKSANPGQLQA
jgi:RNA polymerase sigma-70 factor (ECF subfamily)